MLKFLARAAAAMLAASLPAAALADDAAAPASPGGATQFSAVYSGSVLIFQVADITVSGRVDAQNYSAIARFRAAGLASLFTDADIEAEVSGYNGGTGLRPWQYRHLNHASSKNRVIEINFPGGVAEPNINPPFGSMGEPPASAAQRTNAVDPLTGMFALATAYTGNDGSPCQGSIPMFDGKARYDLRLEAQGTDRVRNRAFRGDAIVCHAYYEPIAGYDPEDQPTQRDIADPVVLWLAPYRDGSVYFPVRIRANAGFGGVTVEARSVEISAAP